MVSFLMNFFLKEQEKTYHRPILNKIIKNLNQNIFNKITYSNKLDIYVKTTYYFYDINNKLIFKLHLTNIFDNNIILVNIKFAYSSNLFLYWTQLNAPVISFEWEQKDSIKTDKNIILVNNFIDSNLLKNKYFDNFNILNLKKNI